ncbi:MAG: hypothetical protein AVDCRST_MAG70-2138, partial [uncultured Thermomicrobiales bacterium]
AGNLLLRRGTQVDRRERDASVGLPPRGRLWSQRLVVRREQADSFHASPFV